MPTLRGQSETFRATLTDDDGQAVDADAATLTLRPPAGVDRTFTLAAGVVRESLGTYRVRAVLDVVGVWSYRWILERGDLVGKDAGVARVIPDTFAP